MFLFRRNRNAPVTIKGRALSLPTLVSLALGGAFLVFLVARFDVDLGATWEHVQDANPWLLALAFLVHYTTFIFRGARWRFLLKNARNGQDAAPGVLYCSQLTLLGWFANSVAWFRLGDAYRAYLYSSEQRTSFSRTAGTILSERLLDTVLLVVLLLVSVPFIVGRDEGTSWLVVALAGGLLSLLLLGLLVMAKARPWLVARLPGWMGLRYQRFHEGALGSLRQLPLVTLLGLGGWLVEVGRLYLVTRALGLEIGAPLIIFITLANSLLTLVPTPGGFGAVEPGVAGLLVRLSALSTSAAAAVVLVDRSISYVSIIFVGGGLFLARQARRRPAPLGDQTVVEG